MADEDPSLGRPGAERSASSEAEQQTDLADSIFETVQNPLLVLDAAFQVQQANPAFYRFFRVTPEETLHHFLYDLGNGQWNIPQLRVLLEELLPKNTHFHNFEVTHAFPDIGQRTLLLNARRVVHSRPPSARILLAFDDVTAQRHMEHATRMDKAAVDQQLQMRTEALERTSTALQWETTARRQAQAAQQDLAELFELFLERVQDYAIFMLDVGGHVVSWNPGATRMMGYQPEEIVGQHFSCFYPRADVQQGKPAHVLQVAAAAGEYTEPEGQRVRKNGTPFWAQVTLTALYDAAGQLRGFTKMTRDVTERKQFEDELRHKDRLAAIGTTVAKLTHEIGNPLNGMSTTLQLLAHHCTQHPTTVKEILLEGIQDLQHETARLESLVQELRNFVRPRPLALQPADLAGVVAAVLSVHTTAYAERNIRIEDAIASDVPLVRADPQKLEQVVLNLCHNAVEAMPAGGTLTVRVTAVGDSVCLDVQDTGNGIAPELDLFVPFVTTKTGGTGLGLVVVQQIIEGHGGTITYTSAPGQGTTFTVRLPRLSSEGAGNPR